MLSEISDRFVQAWSKYNEKRFTGGLEPNKVRLSIREELSELIRGFVQSRAHSMYEVTAARRAFAAIQGHSNKFALLISVNRPLYVAWDNENRQLQAELEIAQQFLNRSRA
jgi:hypothetical protein